MDRIFTFNETPSVFLMKMLFSLLPGIEKVIAVAGLHVKDTSVAYILSSSGSSPEEMEISRVQSVLNRFRVEKAPYNWFTKGDLPFDVSVKDKVQLEIFNELNNNVLLIRLPNKFDNQNDLFFIYFPPSGKNFGFLSGPGNLTAETKPVIATMIRNTLLFQLEKASSDKILFSGLIEHQENLITENSILKIESATLKEKYTDALKDLCIHHLKAISSELSRTFVLTNEAEEKLKMFSGSFSGLYSVLLRAAEIAELSSIDPSSAIPIREHHISLEEKKITREKESNEEVILAGSARYSKTLILLNKLETAARKLKSRNEVLTSAGIGKELPVKISAPAISDALKKHRNKIIFLLKEYPERWTVIRSEFRPVRNIINERSGQEQISA